jgi:hypothetical protein
MVDLLPTIARIIGAELPGPVDGRVADEVPVDALRRRTLTDENARAVVVEDRGLALRAAKRHAAVIGAGEWAEVWRIGPRPELMFRSARDLPIAGKSGIRVLWSASGDLGSVDPEAGVVPALVRVELAPPADAHLVVVLNGRVAASATFARDRPRAEQLLLPPSLLRAGNNELEFLLGDPRTPGLLSAAGEEAK